MFERFPLNIAGSLKIDAEALNMSVFPPKFVIRALKVKERTLKSEKSSFASGCPLKICIGPLKFEH